MRIESFKGEGLHGYLQFKLKFNKEITFLTGINGSGKTTVINATVALISPSLATLANLDYRTIRVDFENEGQKSYIEARKNGTEISLRVDGAEPHFNYSKLEESQPGTESRSVQEYYRELLATNAQHPVLRHISSLPTPMFLGLDRRAALSEQDGARFGNSYRAQVLRRQRNLFGGPLALGLSDAASLAEGKIRDALIGAGRIGSELQRDLMLQLLEAKPSSEFGMLNIPSKAELNQVGAIRRDLPALAKILGLPINELTTRIIPFLDELDRFARDIPIGEDIAKILHSSKPDDPVIRALIFWSSNLAQLSRIRVVSKIVSSYNSKQTELTSHINHYLGLVNAFLKDSGKTLRYDETGYISVQVENLDGDRPVTSLSSGEAQIFVILTHLSFNPAAQAANVFIIDEPELSLHVQWQELFVKSVQAANPGIQYVMATHSPSIILDRLNKCVDVAGRKHANG